MIFNDSDLSPEPPGGKPTPSPEDGRRSHLKVVEQVRIAHSGLRYRLRVSVRFECSLDPLGVHSPPRTN